MRRCVPVCRGFVHRGFEGTKDFVERALRVLKPANNVASGRLDLGVMVTRTCALENSVAAYDLFANQHGGVLKIAIPGGSLDNRGRCLHL